MFNIKQINRSLNKVEPLLDWWFVGVLIIFYLAANNLSNLEGEPLEWGTYIFAFVFALLYFLLNMVRNLKFNLITLLILSFPFYILIFYEYSPLKSHLFFLISSIILYIDKSKIESKNEFKLSNISYLIYYFLFFYFTSKLVHWSTFDNFIWMTVPESSQYYKYSNVIEKIGPILVLTVLFSTLALVIYSLKNDFKWEPIQRFWWVIPGILFFAEAYSTFGFFSKYGGGVARYHWQPYVGVLEMMDQGGFLLWDTPSTYGFLSLVLPYLMPFGNAWQKIYIVNGILSLALGLLILKIIWNKKGLIWYLISISMTLALVYYLPGGQNLNNTAEIPSGGAMRFFWVVLLMYVVVRVRDKKFISQIYIITPIWLVGFLWSVESAFFVSAVLGPYVLYHLFFNPEKSFDHIKYLAIIPISLVLVVILISLFYLWKLGHLPDYYSFIEEAVGNVEGHFSELFTINSPLWVHIIILSWLLSQIRNKKKIHLIFSIWTGIWAVLSYCIGQSVGDGLIKILPIYVFALFLSFIIMDDKNEKKLIHMFIPLFVMILTITFGNPKSARHFYNTITNQDYTLKNASYDEVNDYQQILTIINPGQTPVIYIDETRYLNFLSKRQYRNVNNNRIISLTNKIWLPLHPTTLLHGKPFERQIEYINRWLKKHPIEKGWLIRPKFHWAHSYYKKALNQSLQDVFHVKKSVEHGILKAVLYERIKIK